MSAAWPLLGFPIGVVATLAFWLFLNWRAPFMTRRRAHKAENLTCGDAAK